MVKDMLTAKNRLQKALLAFFITVTSQFFLIGIALSDEIRVSAAASLTDVMQELNQQWEQEHPQQKIKTSFAGSSTLAKQIEHGAPADIFISADKDWADYLEQRSLLDATSRMDLLQNDLVIIAPVNNDIAITMDKDFDTSVFVKNRLCTGDTASVPVGKYAKQALQYYGWWDAVTRNLVETEDVRTALAFVERGECKLGIVYRTDALMTSKVKIIATFSKESHSAIVYPGSLTARSSPEAKQFWLFLQSPKAAAVFERYGFTLFQ